MSCYFSDHGYCHLSLFCRSGLRTPCIDIIKIKKPNHDNLCFLGALDTEEIKTALTQHVVDRRDNKAQLLFPRLRQCLVSCWGNYAWDAHVQFRLENHFLMASGVYRGRPVSDSNIQVNENCYYLGT